MQWFKVVKPSSKRWCGCTIKYDSQMRGWVKWQIYLCKEYELATVLRRRRRRMRRRKDVVVVVWWENISHTHAHTNKHTHAYNHIRSKHKFTFDMSHRLITSAILQNRLANNVNKQQNRDKNSAPSGCSHTFTM